MICNHIAYFSVLINKEEGSAVSAWILIIIYVSNWA